MASGGLRGPLDTARNSRSASSATTTSQRGRRLNSAYAMLMHMRKLGGLVAIAVTLGAIAGCGGGSSSDTPTLKVSAAASLNAALTAYGKQFASAKVSYSFAGSDALTVQIEQGAKPDVFAAADTKLLDQLAAKGLVEQPTVFAANRLVLAVPAKRAKVDSLAALTRGGLKLAIGEKDVPIGSYTRNVLGKLPASQSTAILANVRTEEPDVAGIIGKLTQGAVDAGFLYVSDVRATNGRLKAIELPAALQPRVTYGVAVVAGSRHPEQARAFIDGLLAGQGAAALKAAGFEPPPTT